MNIVMTILVGRFPVQVAVKAVKDGWHAKTLGEQNPVEATRKTFNGALDAVCMAAAHTRDAA